MIVYTARQPILNAQLDVIAYELLFRDSQSNQFPKLTSQDTATAKILVDGYLNIGFEELTQGRLAFINFPAEMLESYLLDLSPDPQLVIEILETLTPSPYAFSLITQLAQKKFRLAFDDFIFDSRWQPILPFIEIIKFDIQQTPLSDIQPLLAQLQNYDIKFLAEKVETYEEFYQAQALGFELFQGYFFFKPEVINHHDIEASQLSLFSLYSEVMQPQINFDKVEQYLTRDLGLSFKLLKFVNSNLFARRGAITSLKQAAIFLGENQLRKFISLMVTAQLNPSKPSILIENTILRARLCEQFAQLIGHSVSADQAFLLGLFSTLDALLDKNMSVITKSLPLTAEVTAALLGQDNLLLNCLSAVTAYINGDWEYIALFVQQYDLCAEDLVMSYEDALQWLSAFNDSISS